MAAVCASGPWPAARVRSTRATSGPAPLGSSPSAATAAARLAVGSSSSAARASSSATVARPGTSPRVSTRRARLPASSVVASAVVERGAHRVGNQGRPGLQGALRQHPAEAAAHHRGHQGGERGVGRPALPRGPRPRARAGARPRRPGRPAARGAWAGRARRATHPGRAPPRWRSGRRPDARAASTRAGSERPSTSCAAASTRSSTRRSARTIGGCPAHRLERARHGPGRRRGGTVEGRAVARGRGLHLLRLGARSRSRPPSLCNLCRRLCGGRRERRPSRADGRRGLTRPLFRVKSPQLLRPRGLVFASPGGVVTAASWRW